MSASNTCRNQMQRVMTWLTGHRKRTIGLTSVAVLLVVLCLVGPGWYRQKLVEQCRRARQSQDWNLVLSTAGKLTKLDSNNGDGRLFLAEAAQQTGDVPYAVEHLRHV